VGLAATIEHDPAFAGCEGVRLVLRAAGRSLTALDQELKESIGKREIVAESEGADTVRGVGSGMGFLVLHTDMERRVWLTR